MQTYPSVQHLYLWDHRKRGLHWANQQFYRHRDKVRGRFVFLLDDDDYLVDPEFVSKLKRDWVKTGADVIVFQWDHGIDGILPKIEYWGKHPQVGQIGGTDFVVKRRLWKQHIRVFGQPSHGDFAFVERLWDNARKIHWHHESHQTHVMGRISRRGRKA